MKFYLNPGQRRSLAIGANSECFICARRFGKSYGIIGPRIIRNVQQMPKGVGGILGASFIQVLTRTLVSSKEALERMGFVQNRDYFIGRKAPKKLNFKLPYRQPDNWDHVIHWYNGSIQFIISQDVKFSSNSMTLDWLIGDEARSFNPKRFHEETMPTLSGTPGRFDNVPWKRGYTLVSDRPLTREEKWIEDYKNKMDPEIIEYIEGLLFERSRLLASDGKSKDIRIERLNKELNFWRSKAFLFAEYDTIENLEIVGEEYIRNQYRDLPKLIFRVSILNQKIGREENGFYASLDRKIHAYISNDNNYINNLRDSKGDFQFDKLTKRTWHFDGDIDPSKPLNIAFDYNANINWIVIGQVYHKELRTINSMYVQNKEKLPELCVKFCEYYHLFPTRQVNYYYDSTAINNNYAVDGDGFCDTVKRVLSKYGWYVNMCYMGKQMRHNLKHLMIDNGLKGLEGLFPTFNAQNNEFLLTALENAGIKIGRNGFEKVKAGEKLKDTDEDPAALRTDGTDAFDTLYIGCNKYPAANLSTAIITTHFSS